MIVIKVVWILDKFQWQVDVKENDINLVYIVYVDFLVFVIGRLNNVKLFDIFGFDCFVGMVMYIGCWDKFIIFENKCVVVIGNGVLGMQIVFVLLL